MNCWLPFVLLCTLLSSPTLCTAGNAAGSKPSIQFGQELFTFGEILEGESVKVSFSFVNRGDLPLMIHDAVTSCGCTTADFPGHPLRPGEAGAITTTFHSKGRGGDNDISLLIKSNDPDHPVKALHIRGEVIRQWEVKPDRFVLTNLKTSRSYRKSFQLINHMDAILRIRELSSSSEHVRLLFTPKVVSPGKVESIPFEVSLADLETGKLGQSSIRVTVANARMESVEIPILIRLK